MTQHDLDALMDLPSDHWAYIICVAVYLTIRFATRAIDAFQSTRLDAIWARALPLVPSLVAVPSVLLGAVPSVASAPVAARIIAGLLVALVAEKTQKIIGQTLLGDDEKISKLLLSTFQTEESKKDEEKK